MNTQLSIVWFYHDLRLADHAALTWAAARGSILPLYISDPKNDEGGASKWWLHEALHILNKDLENHNSGLVLRQGDALTVLKKLIKETGATAITWTRRYEPALAARDQHIADALAKDGLEISIQPGFLLFEPATLSTKSGTPFKVFTPFSKACFAAPPPARLLPVPKSITSTHHIASEELGSFHLIPPKAKWPKGIDKAWQVGEKAGHKILHDFIHEGLDAYKDARNRPDVPGTSRLSPYLHFGHISPRQIWHGIMQAQAQASKLGSSAERYLLELLWREFSWHLLVHVPDLTEEPLQKSFAAFPWRQDTAALQAWQQGRTGYPIVDAGMRQLWQTGWMHNRVRMITASFLIKDLLIDWREGMAWFWDTLVDADLGANTASWQWVAGCGADAAPYYRIFNPTLQGLKFDPNGDYVRTFVPELAKLPNDYIHEPWSAPESVLRAAGIRLGQDYPKPVIDHGKARIRALDALKSLKSGKAQLSEIQDLFA